MEIKLYFKSCFNYGYIVGYLETNTLFNHLLYSSTSKSLALSFYRKARNSIDSRCFVLKNEKESDKEVYSIYKPIIYYIDTNK